MKIDIAKLLVTTAITTVGAIFIHKWLVKPASAAVSDNQTFQNINSAEDIVKQKVSILNNQSQISNQDLELVTKAIIQVESGGRNIAHPDGVSFGLMGLIVSTATWMMGHNITESDLLDPATNIEAGIRYFLYQINRYKDIDSAIVAYHQGSDPLIEPQYFDAAKLNDYRAEADRYLEKVKNELINLGYYN